MILERDLRTKSNFESSDLTYALTFSSFASTLSIFSCMSNREKEFAMFSSEEQVYELDLVLYDFSS